MPDATMPYAIRRPTRGPSIVIVRLKPCMVGSCRPHGRSILDNSQDISTKIWKIDRRDLELKIFATVKSSVWILGGEWGKTGLVDRYRVEENISPSFFFFPSLNRHTASYYTSTAMPPRVSLLDRQNALLAKQGFSSSSSSTTAPRRSNNNRTASGHTKGFTARQ